MVIIVCRYFYNKIHWHEIYIIRCNYDFNHLRFPLSGENKIKPFIINCYYHLLDESSDTIKKTIISEPTLSEI